MENPIRNLPLDRLALSKMNVRKSDAKEGLDTLIASIRAHGVLMPLIVRPAANDAAERFEILAGQRRYLACIQLAAQGVTEPLPCVVVEPGDDVRALELSLAENATQLPMKIMEQYEAFARLAKMNVAPCAIADRFGVSERVVQQRLALAKLVPDLKKELGEERIALSDLQVLTMATPDQQRAWVQLYRQHSYSAPRGTALKQWICGGAHIETTAALFPLEDYTGPLLSDLFGDKTYFGDSAAFWTLQHAAIAQKKADLESAGWSKVIVWQPDRYFSDWDLEPLGKKGGGWAYIVPDASGAVRIKKGFIPRSVLRQAEAAARRDGQEPDAAKGYLASAADQGEESPTRRGELTAALMDYVNLHKQAAVRLRLAETPGLALRVAVAALAGGVATWDVRRDERAAAVGQDIRQSVQQSATQQAYEQRRRDADRALNPEVEPDATPTLLRGYKTGQGVAETLARLIGLSDEDVFHLLAVLVAETLPAGSGLIEVLGRALDIEMRHCWRLDPAFLNLLKDKEALTGIVKELDLPHDRTACRADLQAAIRRRINGEGCKAAEDWLPGYLEFPARGYTDRFNAPSVARYAEMAGALGLPAPRQTGERAPDAPGEADERAGAAFAEADRAAA